MSAEENRNEILSQIVADLFATSKGGEDLSAKIRRLRDELKKVIEHEDTIFGKFHGVAESFREIIPQEMQRYNAAIKALLTTSKISRQDIVKAVSTQLEELKILEKILLGTQVGRRSELQAMEARSRELRDEISKLREKIGQLESEEKELAAGMAVREKEMEPVEKAVRTLFSDIGAELNYIKKRVEEPFTGEHAVLQPVPPAVPSAVPPADAVKSAAPVDNRGEGGQKSEIPASPAPDTGLQKKCPMCGGRMDLQVDGKMWLCYTCAYQEEKKENEGGEQKSEIRESPAQQQDTGLQKKCPMCGGRMDLQIDGKMWLCYTCAYEESGTGGVHGKSEEVRNTPAAAPAAAPSSHEHHDTIKGSMPGSTAHKQPPVKKKNCPACSGKMKWHETEKAWRCPFCGYERRI